MRLIAICLAFLLAACAGNPPPNVRIETVEVVREVPRDCPGTRPERPAPFEQPEGASWERLARLLAAKLAEYSAPGQYADQADAIFDRCPLTAPETGEDAS